MRKAITGLLVFGLMVISLAPITALATTKAKHPVKTSSVVETATLTSLGVINKKVHGLAILTLNQKNHVLTVKVIVDSLKPKSVHADLMYVPGVPSKTFVLKNLAANTVGNAGETTVFHGIHSIKKGSWILVHQGANRKIFADSVVIAQGPVQK